MEHSFYAGINYQGNYIFILIIDFSVKVGENAGEIFAFNLQ